MMKVVVPRQLIAVMSVLAVLSLGHGMIGCNARHLNDRWVQVEEQLMNMVIPGRLQPMHVAQASTATIQQPAAAGSAATRRQLTTVSYYELL